MSEQFAAPVADANAVPEAKSSDTLTWSVGEESIDDVASAGHDNLLEVIGGGPGWHCSSDVARLVALAANDGI